MSKRAYKVHSVEDGLFGTVQANNAFEAARFFTEDNFDNLTPQFTAEVYSSGKRSRHFFFDVEFDLVPEISISTGTSISNAFAIMDGED